MIHLHLHLGYIFLGGKAAVESELAYKDLFVILVEISMTVSCSYDFFFFFFLVTCPGIFQIQRFKSNGLDS